jgi:signal transduction histidine kinase
MTVNAPEPQVRQRLAELARAHRYSVARELAATIAHEINQPLGAMLTNAETLETLLQRPAPDMTELRAIASDIRRDSNRAAGVVRHLLNLLNKSSPEFTEIDLSEPVRDAIHFFSALAVARKAQLSCSIASMPLPVRGNVIQLHQVILSLIVNAVDAMAGLPVDKCKLEIATVRAENSAVVLVSDTGAGIPADRLIQVFEPFYSTREQGMGLGLSIARTIIEGHGGEIWAENKAANGAAFYVRLPLSGT